MNKSTIQKWKKAYLLSNDERGTQIKQTVAWKVSKLMDILLLITLFGLAFFKQQELHVIITIALVIIFKTILTIYYGFVLTQRAQN